jgi:uncharacterized protein (TIGR02284 family)
MDASAIEDLNGLLQGELSAIRSYSEAVNKANDPHVAEVFEQCRTSHLTRSSKLQAAVVDLGGLPATPSGPWGGLSKLVTSGAGVLGDKALAMALEEGEDIGASQYEWTLVKMHGDYRNLVKSELLPEQQRTHQILKKLTNALLDGAWPPITENKEV